MIFRPETGVKSPDSSAIYWSSRRASAPGGRPRLGARRRKRFPAPAISLDSASFLSFRICRKTTLPHLSDLFEQFPYGPEEREAQHAEDG